MALKQRPQIARSDVPFGWSYPNRAQGFECEGAPFPLPPLPLVVVILSRSIFPALCPGLDCLFGYHRVIPAPIAAQHETAHCASFHRLPAAHVPAEARVCGQCLVVDRQTRRRQLVPGCAPQEHGSTELIAGGHDRQLAVAQSRHIEGHERHAAQVNLRGNKRIHVRQPEEPDRHRTAPATRSGSACR